MTDTSRAFAEKVAHRAAEIAINDLVQMGALKLGQVPEGITRKLLDIGVLAGIQAMVEVSEAEANGSCLDRYARRDGAIQADGS